MNDVIEKFGTPTYVFDINILKERIAYLKNKLGDNINLVYAVKANTFIAKEVEELVSAYEICSPGEFDICNKLGISHSKMVISGVYKDKESTEMMVKDHSDIHRFTIESENQWKLLLELAEKYNKHLNVLIRLTSGNQFGVNEDIFKKIIKENNNDLLTIKGIEYFSGTQKHSVKRLNREVDYLIEFVSSIEKEFNITLEEIEYGTGFPVFYFVDDEFNEDEFLEGAKEALNKIKNKKISIELGRSIAASCGTYLTSVVDLKSNQNGNFVIVDGGINHLVYYGGNMAMRVPKFDLLQKDKKEEEIYNLYGSLCTINDILVKNLSVNKLSLGDIFAFKNTGAYSAFEGISLFLSRDLPKVVLKKDNELMIVRESLKTSDINFPNYK